MIKKILSAFTIISCLLVSSLQVQAAESFADSGERTLLPKDQVINHDYFAAGRTVVIEGVVNGDAYIAGESIIMSGVINGDLLVAGQLVEIRGNVTGDIRSVGENIFIYGTIGGNVSAAGKSVELREPGSIAGSVVAGAGRVAIAGPVGKSVTALVGELAIADKIGGNVTYWSDIAATTQDASISGTVTKRELPRHREAAEQSRRAAAGMRKGMIILELVSLLILGLLAMRYVGSAVRGAAALVEKAPGRSLLIGIATLIILPVALLLMIISIIGLSLAGLTFVIFILFCIMAKVVASYIIGHWIVIRLFKKSHEYLAYVVGAILYICIIHIPVIGWISGFGLYLIALGGSLLYAQGLYRSLSTRKKI